MASTAPGPGTYRLSDSEVTARLASLRSDAEEVLPPAFTIDLSRPPAERYVHIAPYFPYAAVTFPQLFADTLVDLGLPPQWLQRAARLLLRRVASTEETAELRGISQATLVPMHVLVAFNVLLDLFMGCTSGGVRVRDDPSPSATAGADTTATDTFTQWPATRMLHFRTLDWGMDVLRPLVVRLDFVRRPEGPVVATSLSYFGYVGVLTGLRPGLTMSLNFRPTHDASTRMKRIRFHAHQLLVLLGWRPSVASVLRKELLTEPATSTQRKEKQEQREAGPSALSVAERLRPQPSTAAYIILCDGRTTVTVEKDNRTAIVRSADDFIVVLNHDAGDDDVQPQEQSAPAGAEQADVLSLTGIEGLVWLSAERKRCVLRLWERDRRRLRGSGRESWGSGAGRRSRESRRSAEGKAGKDEGCGEKREGGDLASPEDYAVTVPQVLGWMQDGDEIVGPETHFGVVMDPRQGRILWLERYATPLTEDSEKSDVGDES